MKNKPHQKLVKYEDAELWAAACDAHGPHIEPKLAKRLITEAPDPDHEMVDVLKSFF